jgi:hypothetical protein
MQHNHLTIKAPQAGVVLAPEKDSNDGAGGDNANKDLHVGTQVKENQNLVSIGDLTGIATTVSVSEMVINQIKPGQAVTVTVTALPDMTLQGVVKSVGAQAQTSGDSQSNNANFPVNIVVPQITPQQRDLIRVGMSAQIQILLPNPPQIMLPITAVYQKNGMSMVKVLNAQGKPQEVPVMTGQTTLDQIAITQGIKAGDKVMVTTP